MYNGEVYNYRELRVELEAAGHSFRTSCDSEVIVHAYEEWGPACAARFNGMWAFAAVGLRETGGGGKLVLNRDHFGIKPLFYARSPHSGRLLFASEIKALLQDPELAARPRRADDVRVPARTAFTITARRRSSPASTMCRRRPGWRCRWSTVAGGAPGGGRRRSGRPGAPAETGPLTAPLAARHTGRPSSARDGGRPGAFRELFRRQRRRAASSRKCPWDRALSGGLDSTTIVGFMSELLPRKRRTPRHCAGSSRRSARCSMATRSTNAVHRGGRAEHGRRHHLHEPYSPEFVEELRDFIWHQEEPIVSTGPYAQWCVMRSAREQVTVLLDGQGGDELIAGYVPYQLVYLRQLRSQGRYAELRHEATAARDVLWPLARRRLSQRRKRLSTGRLLRPEFVRLAPATPATGARRTTSSSVCSRIC